jgi:acyl-CoA synthetase
MRPFLTLHHPALSRSYYDTGLWQKDTFYSLLRHNARNFGDRLALVDARRQLTWHELQAWADGIATDLRTYGLVKGDRVSSWLSSRAESVALIFACSREGFVYNPSLHHSHTCAEVGALMQWLAPRALIAEEGWGADRKSANLDAILTEVPSLKVVYDVEHMPAAAPNLTPWRTDPDSVSYMAFTSLSSGEPKFVMHSDNTLLSNARELVRDWHLSDGATVMPLSPLSHHVGWVAVAQWLIAGCKLALNDPRADMSTLDWVTATGATYVMGVPTHAIDLLAQRRRTESTLGAVETFYLAGAPIAPAICQELLDLGIKPQNVYGMIENSSHHYTLPHDPADVLTNTCGRGGRCYEVRIFDQSDPNRPLKTGEVGQIGGRGASLMLGYYRAQETTLDCFNDDGWFMSGDLGSVDKDGNLHLVGRLKDVIIRGGHYIYPTKIEAVSEQHPAVGQAVCVAIPDDRLGERACLAVRGDVAWEELIAHLRHRGISRFDMPEFLVRMDAFPTTASGRILKRRVTDMIQKREVAAVNVASVLMSAPLVHA